MKTDRRLMVEFGDDSRVDEYRIRGRQVEFRARHTDGASEWRQLTAGDISLHLVLQTPVAEWLTLRRPKGASA